MRSRVDGTEQRVEASTDPEPTEAGVPGAEAVVAALVVAFGVVVLAAGGTKPLAVALGHALLAAVAVVLAIRADRGLTGASARILAAGACLVAVVAVGLLPAPEAVLRALSPGVWDARPGAGSLALTREAAIDDLARLALGVSFAALVAAGAALSGKRRASQLVGVVAATLAGVALVHAAVGAQAVFGVIGVQTPPTPFFAPFVDPAHLGTVMALAAPVAAGTAWSSWRRRSPRRWLWIAVLVTAVLALAATRSVGAWLGLAVAVMVGVALWGRGRTRWVGMASVVGAGLAVAWTYTRWIEPEWAQSSLVRRVQQWGDAPAMWADQFVFGVGGGNYGIAYPAYRSTSAYMRFTHAHSEPVQWVLETGLVGIVGIAVAAAVLGRPGRVHHGRWLTLGLIAAGAHACVDFPLHLPGVLMAVAAVVGLRWGRRRAIGARVARWMWLGLAVAQLPLAAWAVRAAVADDASEAILAFRDEPEQAGIAAGRLAWSAPWRAEATHYKAWRAERDGRREDAVAAARLVAARHRWDADALRRAGLTLARLGALEEAVGVLDRACVRDRHDHRNWAAASRVAAAAGDEDRRTELWAEALLRWPATSAGVALDEALDMLPVGLWWLDRLESGPAYLALYLGDRMVRDGELDVALLAYDQAAFAEPAYRLWPRRARALYDTGQVTEARAMLDELVRRDAGNVAARLELGRELRAMGDPKAAVEVYLEGVELAPTHPGLKLGAIEAAKDDGGPEAALSLVRRFELTERATPRIFLEAARLQHEAGRPGACVRRIDAHGLTAHPDLGPAARSLRARCLADCPACDPTDG